MPEPEIESYWGEEFPEVADSEPVALLKRQAELLSAATAGKVGGVVEQSVNEGTAWASLYLAADWLGDYQYKLLYLAHPVVVPDPANPFPITVGDSFGAEVKTLENMSEFDQWLKERLRSRQARAAVGAMMGPPRAAEAQAAPREAG